MPDVQSCINDMENRVLRYTLKISENQLFRLFNIEYFRTKLKS